MIKIPKQIGNHYIEFTVNQQAAEFIEKNFRKSCNLPGKIDIKITIDTGYGTPFVDYNVKITKENGKIIFKRSDYLIKTEQNYSSTVICINDQLAFKHALMNLYSSLCITIGVY